MNWISGTYFTLVADAGPLPFPYQQDCAVWWNRPLNAAAQVRLRELVRMAGQTARPSVLLRTQHPGLTDRMGVVCEATGIDLDWDRQVRVRLEPRRRAVPGLWVDAGQTYMTCQVETELSWTELDDVSRRDLQDILAALRRQQTGDVSEATWSPSRVLYAALAASLPADDPARIHAMLGSFGDQLQVYRDHVVRAGRSPWDSAGTRAGELEAPATVGTGRADRAGAAPGSSELQEVRSKLARFGRDLSEMAANGTLARAFGRDTEIDRAIRTLLQVEKSNPVFTGPPGVGKSAIAAGVAHRIHDGRVPESLRHSIVIELDITAVVQGTRLRGEFEERLFEILKLARDPRVILFVDELHRIVRAGSALETEGAGEAMKPMLARGEIRVMGATTDAEFHQYVEQDRALERRFARIPVAPPSREQAVLILDQAKVRYEAHHGVVVTHEAVEAAVDLGDRFIRDRHLPDKAFEAIDKAAVLARTEESGTRPAVTAAHVARIVSEMAGVPLGTLTADERERMKTMSAWLKGRVVGQDAAVEAVTEAVQAARYGLKVNPNRPNGCFVFGGPPGVGKTQLARALAEFLFGTDDALVRIDMSELGRGDLARARLLGAAPGYRDSGRGGQLTEAVRRRPASVVLFDEIEKADPDVLDLLIQLCGDGRLTDGMGDTVDFANTVVVLTTAVDAGRGDVAGAIRARLRPELVDRMDRVVVFSTLTAADARDIMELKLESVRQQLRREHGVEIALTEPATRYLLDRGFGQELGARQLERVVTRLVVVPVTNLLADVRISRGDTAVVDVPDPAPPGGGLAITVAGTVVASQAQGPPPLPGA